MRKYFFGIAIATLALIIACVKDIEDEGIYSETEITGTVVEQSSNAAVSNIKVQVTDGEHIHATYTTGSSGTFRMKVNFDQMNKNYYLLLDGSPNLPTKQEKLLGVGKKSYDYKYIVLYNKNDNSIKPKVTTGEVSDITTTSAKVAGKVTSTGGYPLTVRGICYATHQSPTTSDSKKTAGKELGNYTCDLTGLQTNSTYYVRAYATNSIGTTYGAQKSFSTGNGSPSIALSTPTNVTATSATCSATITSDGGAAITARGICWSTAQNPTISGSHIASGSGTGTFTESLTGLTPSTTYYVRAYATNSTGTSYSSQVSFTTADGLPVVTTGTVNNITATSATCSGNVTSDGGFSVTAKGFCWSTSQYPTISSQHSTAGSGTGSFNGSLTNLQPGTTYYVRAYATNNVGTSYGSQKHFTTTSGQPTVTTTAPTLNGTTVVSGGNVTSDGGFAVTARGICYGSFPNPDLTSAYSHTSNGSGTGYYSSSFSLPVGSGTYYIRAYATNANGTSYGEQVTIVHPYDTLPTFMYNGHTYRVAPDPGTTMNWSSANTYCNGLELYGYSDWRLPTKEELYQMYIYRNIIGGFVTIVYNTGDTYYWSSTPHTYYTPTRYWYCDFSNGHESASTDNNVSLYKVRPIRLED